MIEEKEEEKVEALEIVELVDEEPMKTTRAGTTLSTEIKKKLVQFSKDNLDIFAWCHEDMPNISTEIIQHKLNADPEKKPSNRDNESLLQNETRQSWVKSTNY